MNLAFSSIGSVDRDFLSFDKWANFLRSMLLLSVLDRRDYFEILEIFRQIDLILNASTMRRLVTQTSLEVRFVRQAFSNDKRPNSRLFQDEL